MQLLYARGQALRQRGARLDQEQHLAPFLELPLPDVDRGDAGHDVHAGRQLLLHKRPRDPGGLAAVLAGGEADRLAHRVTGELFRSRERTPGTIDRAPSISSSVLRAERLKRIEHFDSSAGTPIAWRTCDGFMLIEAQADPEETQTPAASSARIAASLSTPSTETFRTLRALRSGEPQTRTPPRPSSPARSFSRSPSTRSISSGDASVRAAASPAMPATFSVPARRSNSWPPPTDCAASGVPLRTQRPPTPFGPWSLWAENVRRSTSRRSTGTLPTACAASVWRTTERATFRIAAIGCSDPTSLFTVMMETSTVFGVSAAATDPGSTRPSPFTGTRVTRQPWRSRRATVSSTLGCSIVDVTRWSPRDRSASAAPAMASAFDSVAPDVKTISLGSPPRRAATRSRASSSARRARRPAACRLEAFPYSRSRNGSRAARTSGLTRVVAALSR